MAAKRVKTTTAGVYKRGSRYSVRLPGGRWESARTLDEARRIKALRETEARHAVAHDKGLHRGSPQADCPECQRQQQQRDQEMPMLHAYLGDWIDRYRGTGKRGYGPETREEDRRLLQRFALRYFPDEVKVNEITPKMVDEFVGWLCSPTAQGRQLADPHRPQRIRTAQERSGDRQTRRTD